MDGFTDFLRQRADALRNISHSTKGEHRYEDVCQEAWLMAEELASGSGDEPDFLDPALQEQLLLHLRRKLIYGDRRFRYATRLDHAVGGDVEAGAVHPLMGRLVSDEGRDPLFVSPVRRERSRTAGRGQPAAIPRAGMGATAACAR